jgi:hypothetical protein
MRPRPPVGPGSTGSTVLVPRSPLGATWHQVDVVIGGLEIIDLLAIFAEDPL